MIENFIDIKTKDGLCDTFVVRPDVKRSFSTIIIYMDAPAIREELRDMARRLASWDILYYCQTYSIVWEKKILILLIFKN